MKTTKIGWSARAERNLLQIERFIAQDAPRTAQSFIKRLRKSVNRLRRFPESGWIVEEAGNPSILEIVFKSYRIIYHYDHFEVVILAVLHGSQLLNQDSLL